jgi:hypothetical protein
VAANVEKFLSGVHTLAWDEVAADQFAKVRTDLERGGTPIGRIDTNDCGPCEGHQRRSGYEHFRHVKGVAIENWAK